ncbi:Putative dehydrogenase [Podospora comata]|uniref:Dehydrogenase n=1 Tax=Podospora comata TaxID=48703 RepID=A0ABY6SG36_PODCO|nr:Putative dehydrogenase [Podospora comata]
MSSPKTYLITGTTSGIGLALVQHLLSQSQNVIATGRNIVSRIPSDLVTSHPDNLKLLELDIASPLPHLQSIAAQAWDLFPGGIDVLFNNAGMSAMKPFEEASEEYISQIYTVNLFGPMRLTQAFLPLFRNNRKGVTIAFTSSSSTYTPLPFMSHYSASKSALSTTITSLAKELLPFHISVLAFECGGTVTNLGQPRQPSPSPPPSSSSLLSSPPPQETPYAQGIASLITMFTRDPPAYMPGSPSKMAKTMVSVINKIQKGEKVPVRLVLGSDAWESVNQNLDETQQVLQEWKHVSWGTDRDGVKGGAEGDYLRAVSIL